MTKQRIEYPRPAPEAIVQHQEFMHQASERKRLMNQADYMLAKWELDTHSHKALMNRIQSEYDAIMKEVRKIYK